jgi:hypothetical protein
MSLVELTRPDDTLVAINPDEVVHLAPVPTSGPTMGPLSKGTRIVFRNLSHQDVKELPETVISKINAARSHVVSSMLASKKLPNAMSRSKLKKKTC